MFERNNKNNENENLINFFHENPVSHLNDMPTNWKVPSVKNTRIRVKEK